MKQIVNPFGPYGLVLLLIKKTKTSSKKPRPSRVIKEDLDRLTEEFEAALKFESTAKEEDKEYQALLDKLVGRRVIITRSDQYGGKIATMEGPKGKSKKPLYWKLKLENSSVIWKTRDHFRLLSVSTSKSK